MAISPSVREWHQASLQPGAGKDASTIWISTCIKASALAGTATPKLAGETAVWHVTTIPDTAYTGTNTSEAYFFMPFHTKRCTCWLSSCAVLYIGFSQALAKRYLTLPNQGAPETKAPGTLAQGQLTTLTHNCLICLWGTKLLVPVKWRMRFLLTSKRSKISVLYCIISHLQELMLLRDFHWKQWIGL